MQLSVSASYRYQRDVRHLEVVKRVQPSGIALAQHDANRAAVADDEGGRLACRTDIPERRQHAPLLIEERFAPRKAEALAGAPPGGVELGLLALDVDEPPALPVAAVRL